MLLKKTYGSMAAGRITDWLYRLVYKTKIPLGKGVGTTDRIQIGLWELP